MRYDDLDRLNDLRQKGAITDAEYEAEKAKLLGPPRDFWGMDERTFAMLIHLSRFASYVVPLSGLVLPVVMWTLHKDRSAFIDQNGRNAINWLISSVIYFAVSGILCLVVVGIPLFVTVALLDTIFCILAGVKARDGLVWRYPLSIRFV